MEDLEKEQLEKEKLKLHAKLEKKNRGPVVCEVCRKEIMKFDLEKCEYVKTKRGTEMFVHRKCVTEWGQVK